MARTSRMDFDVLDIPVQDSFGIVYRNVYCAFCHSKTNTVDWITYVECDELVPIQVRDAGLQIKLPNNVSSQASCVSHMEPANEQRLVWCNVTDQIPRRPRLRARSKPVGGNHLFPLSFSILMNFGLDGRGHVLFTTAPVGTVMKTKCRPNQIYDPYSAICRRILCSEGYHPVNGECQELSRLDNSSDQNDADLNYLKYMDETAYVTLYMNMTQVYMFLLNANATTLTEKFKTGICHNLNISCERLQNFTYKLTNYTKNSGTYDIQRAHVRNGEPAVILGTTNPLEHTVTYNVTGLDVANANLSIAKADDVPSEKNTTEPEVYTLEVGFLLIPSNEDNAYKTSVDSIVQQIAKQIQTKSFTLIINGTNIEVGDYDKQVKISNWCQRGERYLYVDRDFRPSYRQKFILYSRQRNKPKLFPRRV